MKTSNASNRTCNTSPNVALAERTELFCDPRENASYLLSIVVPFFNSEGTIQRVFDSLNCQQGAAEGFFEVILVDDGSANPFQSADYRFVFPLRVFRTVNQGPFKARLFGVVHALGKYVYFVDSDDWLMPSFVSDFVSLLALPPFDICLVAFRKKGADVYDQSPFPPEIDEAYYCRNLVGTGSIGYSASKIFRRELFDDISCDITVSISEDLLLSMAVFRNGCRYIAMPSVYYCYEQSPNSLSSNVSPGLVTDTLFVLDRREEFVLNHQDIPYSYQSFLLDIRATLVYIRKLIFHCPRNTRHSLLRAFLSKRCVHDSLRQKTKHDSSLSKKDRLIFLLLKAEAFFNYRH